MFGSYLGAELPNAGTIVLELEIRRMERNLLVCGYSMNEKQIKFIPGLELSKLFYQQEVRPILDKYFSDLNYSAALLGWGSEVLGYDTPVSRDHHWGPRVIIFLDELNHKKLEEQISEVLSDNLPVQFMGYSTNFSKPELNGVRRAIYIKEGPVSHMVDIYTIRSFFKMRLGFDPYQKIEVNDWLVFPQQRLLEVVSGEVFYDGLGELNAIRNKFNFYPKDVWYYLLASQWFKISEEEAFVGRCGDAGDELGSRIVAARIVRELMILCFVMEKRYIPYSKWLGTAFSKLDISEKLTPVIKKVLSAAVWREREQNLARAYEIIAEKHNALGITEILPTKAGDYYGRPYLVIGADKFAEAIRAKITDEKVSAIKLNIGGVDQFIDCAGILEKPLLLKKFKNLFGE